jgi:hypothetical protein
MVAGVDRCDPVVWGEGGVLTMTQKVRSPRQSDEHRVRKTETRDACLGGISRDQVSHPLFDLLEPITMVQATLAMAESEPAPGGGTTQVQPVTPTPVPVLSPTQQSEE